MTVPALTSKVSPSIWSWFMRYDLERHAATTSAGWALWVVLWHPIHRAGISSTLGGFYAMDLLFHFLPFASDYIWGPAILIPSLLQIVSINSDTRLVLRKRCQLAQAFVFLVATILIAITNWQSPGVPMYGMLSLLQCINYTHLDLKQTCIVPPQTRRDHEL